MPFNQLEPLLFRKVAIFVQYTYFVFLVHISKAFSKCEDSWKTHHAICINLKNSFIPTPLYLRYTRESEMLRPRFYIGKNTCRPLAKKIKSFRGMLARAKIQFEGDNATRPQELHGESVSVFIFILMLILSRPLPFFMRNHSGVEGSCYHF